MNTTELITALRIHGSFPTSNDLFSTTDFLVLFNHQLQVDLTPIMMKLNEEYFLQYKDFTVNQGLTYRIPTRAVGAKIRDLKMIDGSGNISQIDRLYEEDRPLGKSGYYMLRNSVELSSNYTGGTLRMKYYARPSSLVEVTACAKIASIDTMTSSVEVESVPTTFTTGIAVDLVQDNNPYDLLGMDYLMASVSGTTLTFSSLPSDLAVGDWVCLPAQSPVPMLPEEMHPVLIQSALCKTLSSKKDKSYKDELETLLMIKESAINMLDPRVDNNSVKFRSGKLMTFFSSRGY